MTRVKYATKSILLLAVLASLFSLAKFQHCATNNFGSPDVYVHACYSDLPALFGARALNTHQWPYTSATNAVEYPPLTGVVMWATSLVASHDSYRLYFYINALLLALLFIGVAYLLARMRPQFWYLLPLSPAVVASMFINWDLWAVLAALIAIYLFDKKSYNWSAIALGISIATKFFPIVLLAPVVLILWHRKEIKRAWSYVGITAATWLVINLPFMVTTWDGWLRFFTLNKNRTADFGSIYYAWQLLYPHQALPSATTLSILCFILLTGALCFYSYFIEPERALSSLATASFLFVAIFTVTSKVYSPQYILWLAPLGILAMRSYRDRAAFWIWQIGEAIYHLAIWEYLAKYTGAKFGIPGGALALATIIRLVTTVYFGYRVSLARDVHSDTPLHKG